MQLCRACDHRCLLGPFVFSSWDLMAWMLLKIFFWWPIMVMPRLRTSLENKDTVKDTRASPRETPAPHGPAQKPRLALLHSPFSTRLVLSSPPGMERLPFPWACPPDKAPVGSRSRITPDRLGGDKINAVKLDSVLVRCPQIIQSERRMDDEPSPFKGFSDVHEKQGSLSAQSQSKGLVYSPQSMHTQPAVCVSLSLPSHCHRNLCPAAPRLWTGNKAP